METLVIYIKVCCTEVTQAGVIPCELESRKFMKKFVGKIWEGIGGGLCEMIAREFWGKIGESVAQATSFAREWLVYLD